MTDQELIQKLLEKGVHAAAIIETEKVPFDPTLRQYCNPQACASYGKNWGCPPDVGEIEELIAEAKQYPHALLYQTIGKLDDPFDYDGIVAGGNRHRAVTNAILPILREFTGGKLLPLSAGGCSICEECAKLRDKPCPFPEKAIASVSSYGIYVSELAKRFGLVYHNGEETVTMFGVIFYE